jgi:opacity protein-like surface antigen
LLVGARYFSIQADEFSEADVDATNWDLDLGARFQMPLSPVITVFGEAMVIYSTVKFSGPGGTIDGAGVGFAVRAGGMFAVRGNLAVGAALGYSHASADIDEVGELGAGWLGLEAFVSFGF